MSEQAWRDRLREAILTELSRAREDRSQGRVRFGEASALVELVDAGRDERHGAGAVPGEMAEAVAGAILHRALFAAGEESRPPEVLADELMYVAILPYLGRGAARGELKGSQSAR